MSTYKEATGKSIEQAFKEFDQKNPKIYQLFLEQVLRAQKRGKKKLSSKAIINWIRWEVSVKTDSEDGYKINDAFTAMYARKYRHDFPHNKHLFEFRTRKSMDLSGTIKKNDNIGISNTRNLDTNDVKAMAEGFQKIVIASVKKGQSNFNF